jgi:4-amino-4-deoxy-L-arabinose transferase-like glycosyltransferase
MRQIAPLETWERWRGGPRVFHKAPLYAYLLALMRRLGGDGFWGFAIAQLILGVLSVSLVFILTDRYFGLGAATLAGLGAAGYGPFLLHETLLLRDSVTVTVSLLLLWALSRCTAETSGRWFVAGLLLAVAFLARELTLLFAPFVVLWIAQRYWRERRTLVRVLCTLAAGVALGLLPVVTRNVVVGAPPLALSSLGNEGFVYGHARHSRPAGFAIPPDAPDILRRADGRLGEAIRLTLASFDGDWAQLARQELARFGAMFAAHEAWDNVNWYYFLDRWPLLTLSLRWEFVLAFGLVGIVLARRRRSDDHLLLYFLLTALAGLQFTIVVGRYRLVPAAVLLVYGGVALSALAAAVRERRLGATLAMTISALAIVVASWSLLPSLSAQYRDRPAESLIAASSYIRQREPTRAYEEARAGLEMPNPETFASQRADYVLLGQLLLYAARESGRLPEATAFLRVHPDAGLRRLVADD